MLVCNASVSARACRSARIPTVVCHGTKIGTGALQLIA